MKIQCVWEHNGNDTLLYAVNLPGAYARGESKEIAMEKMVAEACSYLRWKGECIPEDIAIEIVQDASCDLQICDADSDVLFESEQEPLTQAEYERLKLLVLRSARDFRKLYDSVPNPDISGRPRRQSFYGPVPRTPREMYEHTNRVTAYYAAAFGIELENMPDIYANRMQVLSELEDLPDFLSGKVYTADDGEEWTMRKVLRRFLWHDRIHAKAMWRTAKALWGEDVANPFYFVG